MGCRVTTSELLCHGQPPEDDCCAVAQDEEEWRKTAEEGTERLFHGEMDPCRES